MSAKDKLAAIFERFIWKITSGRFILTLIIGSVYAYLACTGGLDEARVNEITLVVLYAYFSKDRKPTKIDKTHETDTNKPE